MFEPTVRGNIETLAQRIAREGVAPFGPVSIGPGEGHVRLNDGTHDTGYLDFNGLQVRYRGALTGLTWLTESFADSVEAHAGRLDGHDGDVARIDAKNGQQDGRLDGHDGTLSSHGTRLGAAEDRLGGLDSAVAAKASSEWVSGQLGQLSTSLSTKAATTYVDTVNDKANSAITAAATAQARADNAHTRIDGLNYASPNDLAALEGRIASVESHIGVIDSWLRQHTGYPNGGLDPNS